MNRSILNMTSTLFIDRFLSGLPNYMTCIPSDFIFHVKDWSNTHVQMPCFFIVNTSPSHVLTQGHWLLIVIYSIQRCELFDSLALPADQLPVKILDFLSTFKKVIFSSKPIQSPFSNFCGIYTIARALSVCQAEPIAKFYGNFQEDLLYQNDILATKYIIDNIATVY